MVVGFWKIDFLPIVLYGVGTENLSLKVDLKEFKKIYQKAGESSLIPLQIEGGKEESLIFHSLNE